MTKFTNLLYDNFGKLISIDINGVTYNKNAARSRLLKIMFVALGIVTCFVVVALMLFFTPFHTSFFWVLLIAYLLSVANNVDKM